MYKYSGSLKAIHLYFVHSIQNLILLVICLCTLPAFAQEMQFHAKVIAVHDGDSIRVQDTNGQKHRIRLAYIDAPELNQTGGQQSRQHLMQLLVHQNVHIDVFDTDSYRRKVARVSLNGIDINLQQIAQGNAWHYRSIARDKQNRLDYQRYHQAEAHAKLQRVGLWHNQKAQAPWVFRHGNHRAQKTFN